MGLLWKLGGVAIALAAAYFLVTMYGGARYKQGSADSDRAWSQKVIAAEREKLVAYQQGVASVQAADASYIETIRERVVPLTRTIVERTTAYAQTPAGATQCLAPDRVLWLEQARGSLFPPATPAPTDGTADPLHTDSSLPGRGWLNVLGPGGAEPGAGGPGSLRL